MRDGIRFVGDVLATVLPNMREMGDALQPLGAAIQDILGDLRGAMGDIGTRIRELLIAGIHGFAKGVGELLESIRPMIPTLAEFGQNMIDVFNLGSAHELLSGLVRA